METVLVCGVFAHQSTAVKMLRLSSDLYWLLCRGQNTSRFEKFVWSRAFIF